MKTIRAELVVCFLALSPVAGIAASRTVQIQLRPQGSTYLQFVLFASDGQAPSPTGTLNVTMDASAQGSAAVAHGSADLANSSSAILSFPYPLAGGDHPVSVQYSGDSNYQASTASFVKSVAKTAVPMGVPAVTAAGFTVTLSDTYYAPTGSIAAQLDGGAVMTAPLRAGTNSNSGPTPSVATFTWPAGVTSGAHNLNLSYSGDNSFFSSSQSFVVQIPAALRTVQFSFAFNSQATTVSISLTPSDANGPKPTGTVSALLDTTSLGTFSLIGGSGFSSAVVLALPKLSSGPHTVAVQYAGDSSYAAVSGTYSFTTAKPVLSTNQTTLTSTYGSFVTVQVLLNDPSGTAQGSVSLLESSTTLSAANVLGGVASFSLRGLSVGTHLLTARFTGNLLVDDLALPAIVIAQAPTQIQLSGTPVAGTNILLSVNAAVTFAASTGSGNITFQENGATLATVPASASASFSTAALAPGTHTLTARYSGDANYLASVSAPLTFQVGALPTATAITSVSPPSPAPGSSVTVSVAVTCSSGIPTGQVSLLDNGSIVATATLTAGATATFQLTLSSAPSHTLTASYQGSPAFAASTSAASPLGVSQALFTTVSSASGTADLAPGSLASAFGTSLSTQSATARLPFGTTLGGVTITLTDSSGASIPAPLVFVSPSQINFVIPPNSALGPAQLKLVSTTQTLTGGIVLTAQAPALFSADGTGSGVAAAFLVLAHADGTQTVTAVFQCSATACTTFPLSLGASSDVAVLSLYGSGFDKAFNLQVKIGASTIAPIYAGPQGQFPGLDQVNVRIPASLAGTGVQQLSILAGTASNSLSLEFH